MPPLYTSARFRLWHLAVNRPAKWLRYGFTDWQSREGILRHIYLLHHRLLWAVLLVLAGTALSPTVVAQDTPPRQPTDLQIYLLIGQSNMAGRAPVREDTTQPLDRCYLLNAAGEWEPAKNPLNAYSTIRKGLGMQKLGPGYGFAKTMLQHNKDVRIGLVVNARGGSSIEQWEKGGKFYQDLLARAKVAAKSGTIKGIVWHQGESNSQQADEYLAKLKKFITDLRTDLGDESLPFVAGQITNKPPEPINDEIAKLPRELKATAVASSQDLKTIDRWHFDADSQLTLGERYAEQMLELLRQQKKADSPAAPVKPIRYIDVHVHAYPCREGGLDIVSDWMKRRGIDRVVISPLNHKGSRDYNDDDRRMMLANFAKYRGRMDRMCIIDPGEVATVDEAVAILKKEVADGAIAFGEHYGVGLMFDDPQNLLLYEACEQVGLPVMFHIDQHRNKVEPGMERVKNVLKKFPRCNLIAHAYWWRQLRDADRQLSEFPNLYADLSGHVVPSILQRDPDFARVFCIRHQDKLLFGTDEGWWSFNQDPSPFDHYRFFESLHLPDEVRYKIYRGNAEKLFGWETSTEPVTETGQQ